MKQITQKLSFRMVRLPKDEFRVEMIDLDGQVVAEWTNHVDPKGTLTIGPFLFALKFTVE